MPVELNARLTNATLAMEVYASPYTAIIPYPAGTPEREGITEAYRAVQRILGSKSLFFTPFIVDADNQSPVSVSVYPLSSVLCYCETLISVLLNPGTTRRRMSRRIRRGSRTPVSGNDSGAKLRGHDGSGLPCYVFLLDST